MGANSQGECPASPTCEDGSSPSYERRQTNRQGIISRAFGEQRARTRYSTQAGYPNSRNGRTRRAGVVLLGGGAAHDEGALEWCRPVVEAAPAPDEVLVADDVPAEDGCTEVRDEGGRAYDRDESFVPAHAAKEAVVMPRLAVLR